ncbi:MAG: hypothetical protein B6I26_03580 [Desulfobacteraceae bacterium 4572_130]|nr:MAG: hypothetical protein B6I26_03580 [Desulfobacteraceae bacterium 4572_130]
MPIYEYKCKKCCHCFEKLVFKDDNVKIVCPKCENDNVQKLLSATRFINNTGLTSCADSPKSFS